jgi:hypothetical protein
MTKPTDALDGLTQRVDQLEENAWATLETVKLMKLRLERLEAHVQHLDTLMAPLKIMPDAELGEPQTALDFLSYLVGILKGRIDVLTERVDAQELRWKEFTSL